jgi:hypothetical protein
MDLSEGDGQKVNAAGYTLLFYGDPEPLDPARHGELSLIDGEKTYDFARGTNSVPLNAVEFISAARHYPILFNGDERGMPLALLGLRAHENLFVEDGGLWAEGCYIPAFVRRYPFALMNGDDSSDISLCVDPTAERIVTGGERLLFKDGTPSPVLHSVARFCASYAREQIRTRHLVNALREADLLIERTVDIALRDGEKVAMRGFRVVDEKRLASVPEELVVEWWRKGWMGAIYGHLVSLGNFGRLYVRAGGPREAE